MRYALIIAGGSGTRLWPMSTRDLPKQLIPFIDGKSLLRVSMDRLEGLVPAERIYVCAGQATRQVMLDSLPGLTAERFIGEPMGRDTLNAVGLGTGVLGLADPEAVVAIFTADHIIEPVEQFQRVVAQGFELAEAGPRTLVTFGIEPTHPATGYGYLELGEAVGGVAGHAFIVDQFKEKPDEPTARQYLKAGPSKYLWNSGMFVWRASALLGCIEKYAPDNFKGLSKVFDAWSGGDREAVLAQVYPTLRKISVDYAVMEPASRDPQVTVAAVPMPLRWLDVGSWPAFAQTREKDAAGNVAAGCRHVLLETRDTLVASNDCEHLITAIGVEGLIVIHTPRSTLVCRADDAEAIKRLHAEVGEQFGGDYL